MTETSPKASTQKALAIPITTILTILWEVGVWLFKNSEWGRAGEILEWVTKNADDKSWIRVRRYERLPTGFRDFFDLIYSDLKFVALHPREWITAHHIIGHREKALEWLRTQADANPEDICWAMRFNGLDDLRGIAQMIGAILKELV